MIGTQIKKLRKSLGMSQEELAEKAKVHPNTIARWEREELDPRGSSMTKLANALNTSAAYLMGLDTDASTSASSSSYSVQEPQLENIPDPSFFVKEKDLIGNGKVLLYEGNGQRFILPATQENQSWFRNLMAGAITGRQHMSAASPA